MFRFNAAIRGARASARQPRLHGGSENVIRSIMQITCPACATRYELPPNVAIKLPARVHCAQCGAEWEATATEAIDPVEMLPTSDDTVSTSEPFEPSPTETQPGARSEPKTEAASTPADTDREPEPDVPTLPIHVTPRITASDSSPLAVKGRVSAAQHRDRVLWGGSVAAVTGLIVLFLVFHGAIASAWPPSLRLYQALGLG
ncbi:zinc-ribbon domain-containing protein [Acidiphilium sp.]|uniref:zinc-ribbon domain-containing protein n=1 Tax=Acidiphilium sp. TaxID=527 RepID=UPI003D04E58F